MSDKRGALSASLSGRSRFATWQPDDGNCFEHFVGEWPQEIDREDAEGFLELIANATELVESGVLGEPKLAALFVVDRLAKALIGDEAIEISLFVDDW